MRRGSRGLKLDYVALHARYMAGESGVSLAREIGIDYSGLYRSWKRRGLPIRTGSEAALLIHEQRPDLGSTIVAAQTARRGRTDPMARREQRAQTREARGLGISDHEQTLAVVLRQRGITFRQQMAIGPYNADFAFDDRRLVLEVEGGGHNPRVRAMRDQRRQFMETQGWRVVYVRVRQRDWLTAALAHLV